MIFICKERVGIIAAIVMLISSAVSFAEEETTTTVTQSTFALPRTSRWEMQLMASGKLSMNPWMFGSEIDSISRGLNIGVEVMPSYGPIAILVGYQYMGVLNSKGSDITWYNNNQQYITRNTQDHILSFVPLFYWPRGWFRPYIGLGPVLTIKSISTSYTSLKIGGVEKIEHETDWGLALQYGVNFHLGNVVVGTGMDMLFHDINYLSSTNKSFAEVMEESSYFVVRVGYSFYPFKKRKK